jgi:hypothetical protein
MVELDVLMKFHYRTGFGNPVILSEKSGCKVGESSKVGSKDGFAIWLRNKLQIWEFQR